MDSVNTAKHANFKRFLPLRGKALRPLKSAKDANKRQVTAKALNWVHKGAKTGGFIPTICRYMQVHAPCAFHGKAVKAANVCRLM
jgi:hypothetical protein